MKGNAELFSMVMEKYRLVDPLTVEQQAFILKSRKKVFKAILKKYKKYSMFLWLAVVTAIVFRSLGIKLSFMQSKVVLAAFLATATAGSSVATYTGVKYIYHRVHKREVMEIREMNPLEEIKSLMEIPAMARDEGRKNAAAVKGKNPVSAAAGPRSLEDIRKQYKNINIITMFSGKLIKGAIISWGETLSILTTDGVVSVPRKDIQDIKIEEPSAGIRGNNTPE